MRFIKIILNFFKRKDKTKSLNEGNLQYTENKEKFKESLKTEKQIPSKKKKVETMVCDGDGLGISTDIKY